jgi:hypothetical protein
MVHVWCRLFALMVPVAENEPEPVDVQSPLKVGGSMPLGCGISAMV